MISRSRNEAMERFGRKSHIHSPVRIIEAQKAVGTSKK